MTTANTHQKNVTGRAIRLRKVASVLLLPISIAATNQYVLWWFIADPRRDLWQVAVCFVLFVLQVGIAGVVAARLIPGILSWMVFGWTLFLIDLLTFCMSVSYSRGWEASGPMLASALISGQVGAVIVWGVLGDQGWGWRVPIAASAASVILSVWRLVVSGLLYFSDWFSLLCLQSALLCALCVVLRGRGCRVMKPAPQGQDGKEATARRSWQFNLKEIFIQMTTIAIVMSVFRANAAWRSSYSRQFTVRLYLSEIALAALLAGAMMAALWVVFGDRKWWVRLPIVVVVVSVVGALIAWCCERLDRWTYSQQLAGVYLWEEMWFIRPKWWWLPWICLATGFLVATLWIFREHGYRLIRMERRRDGAKGN